MSIKPVENQRIYSIAFAILFIAVVAIAVLACTFPAQGASPSYYRYKALAVLSLKRLPTPAPKPLSDKCENCNGTGKLGDGTVFVPCPVCDGTGKSKTTAQRAERSVLEKRIGDEPVEVEAGREARQTLRQKIKVVVYSMDGCIPCVRLHDAIESELPKQGWKLGTATGHVEACQSDADIVFVHHPAGEELFSTYPTVCVYSNGRFVKRFWGSMSAAQVARKWLEQYEAELSQ